MRSRTDPENLWWDLVLPGSVLGLFMLIVTARSKFGFTLVVWHLTVWTLSTPHNDFTFAIKPVKVELLMYMIQSSWKRWLEAIFVIVFKWFGCLAFELFERIETILVSMFILSITLHTLGFQICTSLNVCYF